MQKILVFHRIERVFIVSIRKDIDTGLFEFPMPFELKLRLKDMLEDEVDEKFFLSDKALQGIKNSTYDRKKNIVQKKDYCDTLLSRDYKDPKCVEVPEPIRLGNIYGEKFGTGYAGNVWDQEGISPTLMSMQGGNRQPLVVDNQTIRIPQATKQGYVEMEAGGVADLSFPNSTTRRGRVQDGGNICPTITDESNGLCKVDVDDKYYLSDAMIDYIHNKETKSHNFRVNVNDRSGILESPLRAAGDKPVTVGARLKIRKLTPKECFRLMGFDDKDFDKCSCSNTQLYKQAGNSIVVDVAEELLCMMFDEKGNFFV